MWCVSILDVISVVTVRVTETVISCVVVFLFFGIRRKEQTVSGNARARFGTPDMKATAVLNLFTVPVKVSTVFVTMLGRTSGSAIAV